MTPAADTLSESRNGPYDLILVGTGFASTFFLAGYLKAAARCRILVLERGERYSHAWQLEHRVELSRLSAGSIVNRNPEKPWIHSPYFGGGSNCWWGNTPRLLPNDFRIRSRYGVGLDWPLGYEDLEAHYQEAEELMGVAGPSDGSPFPRRRPYPQPAHRLTEPDRLLKTAYPGQFFPIPSARARLPTRTRPPCCATGSCSLCPINAKFTIASDLAHLYDDPRVRLVLGAEVQKLEHDGRSVTSVVFQQGGARRQATGVLVGLGANALFNPFLLKRSGIAHSLLGARLHEQVSLSVVVDLEGLDNFQGSTSLTGHGYMLYDGEHRAERAACLLETSNVPQLRLERGRWRQRMELKLILEDLPDARNRVRVNEQRPGVPAVDWQGCSDYTERGLESARRAMPRLLEPLPVQRIVHERRNPTEGHILGTTLMGNDPQESIVDRELRHHRLRNLLVLGGSTFPTSSPANPTLTIAALSLWAAARALGPRR